MAFVLIRIDRTSKPPIGTPMRSDGHWSVQGLELCSGCGEGGGASVFDVATGKAGKGTDLQWVASGVQLNGSSSKIACPKVVAVTPPFSIVSLVELSSTPASHQTIFSTGSTASVGNVQLLGITDTGTPYTRTNRAGTWSPITLGPVALYKGSTVLVSAVHASAANRVCYVGADAGTVNTTNLVPVTCNVSNIGVLQRSTFSDWLGQIVSLLAVYSRALLPSEIASLSANPWQIYEPETVWVEVGGGGGGFTGIYAAAQAAQDQSITSSLVFDGYSIQTQPSQPEIINTLLQFSGGTAQVQAANSEALLAALSFSAATTQAQAHQAQAIYQALLAITGAVSQEQAAQIASLVAALSFGWSSAQTQATQVEALAAVLSFSGETDQDQTAQSEALAGLLSFGGDIDQAQAIQIEALTAILAALDITGTVEQVQARQLQAASDFVAQVHAILRVTASDPLALTISVRDPLALRVTVH